MKLWSDSLGNEEGGAIPPAFAFGKADPNTHLALSDNKNPDVHWSDLPAGTKSLVLICHDYDVPTKADDVNKEGHRVPYDLPRTDFYHWVLVDLAPEGKPIAVGEVSSGITPRGKSGYKGSRGLREGKNDYTGWFAGDADMKGNYFGYDGPCPPWNDEREHHYVFTLYATDLSRCPVEGDFTGPEVKKAIAGHVLGEARMMRTYHIYPEARE